MEYFDLYTTYDESYINGHSEIDDIYDVDHRDDNMTSLYYVYDNFWNGKHKKISILHMRNNTNNNTTIYNVKLNSSSINNKYLDINEFLDGVYTTEGED